MHTRKHATSSISVNKPARCATPSAVEGTPFANSTIELLLHTRSESAWAGNGYARRCIRLCLRAILGCAVQRRCRRRRRRLRCSIYRHERALITHDTKARGHASNRVCIICVCASACASCDSISTMARCHETRGSHDATTISIPGVRFNNIAFARWRMCARVCAPDINDVAHMCVRICTWSLKPKPIRRRLLSSATSRGRLYDKRVMRFN